MQFVEVILPLPLHGTFTYKITQPHSEKELVGARVIVPFGPRKIYTGVIARVLTKSVDRQVKEVIEVLDESPIMQQKQLEFQEWIARYYMCAKGEVYAAALPSGLKLTSESYVMLIDPDRIDQVVLTDREHQVVELLVGNELSVNEIGGMIGLKNPQRILMGLASKGLISLFEKLKDKYVPKKEARIRLHPDFQSETTLDELLARLERKPKQVDVLLSYLKAVPILADPSSNTEGMLRSTLLEDGVSPSSIKTLIKGGYMEIWEQPVDRFSFGGGAVRPLPELSDAQDIAYTAILKQWEAHSTVLLRGITGSGKTEIYMRLIQETIERGQQVLYLLPEIALTTQIIQRFRVFFGNGFGVYHSRFSDSERTEIYTNCLAGRYDFVIGVRSSIFLPFHNLGLIIIDEEHEHSYKQYDPAPRYHARDAALYLANQLNSKVLLGSATPSLESYFNAKEQKYGFVNLDERYDGQPLPKIEVIDMARARKKKQVKGDYSHELLHAIDQAIESGKQVILFQNRRGYSPYIQCSDCLHIPSCPNCSVNLTYHSYQNQLICHYCGYKQFNDTQCENCNKSNIRTVGMGTEKIEEELSLLRPDLKIKRMDLDTTRSKFAYQQIIDDFESGSIQVLIGTQMVSKGLDFEHVSLVGVFDIDRLIHFPDFRSHERAFQMITQVSGRSGRKHERGRVLLQTSDPLHEVVQHVREGHLDLFYQKELDERGRFNYPPFFRLVRIVVRHRDKHMAGQGANRLYLMLSKDLGTKLCLGPIEPYISKLRNYYVYEILIKIDRKRGNLHAIKEFLKASRDTLLALPSFKSVLVHFDVDPL